MLKFLCPSTRVAMPPLVTGKHATFSAVDGAVLHTRCFLFGCCRLLACLVRDVALGE